MARAKRTDRADVRRRYRAQLAADPAAEPDALDEGTTADAPTGGRATRPVTPTQGGRGNRPAALAPGARPGGMRYGFRAAFRSANLRDDFAHLPVILGSRALWLSLALVAGTAVLLIATSGNDGISRIVAPYTLLPPPIVAIFITGFFAPRASYIGGALVGLVSAIGLAAVISLNPGSLGLVVPPNQGAGPGASGTPAVSGSPGTSGGASPSAGTSTSSSPAPASASAGASGSAAAASAGSASPAASGAASPGASAAPSPSPSSTPITPELVQAAKSAYVRDGFLNSPLMGVFFAAAAAWYRRFLALANPNRSASGGGNRGRSGNANRGRPQRRR